MRNAFNGDIYTSAGNHEYLVHTSEANLYYEFSMFNKDAVFGDINRNYYYIDNNHQKIRYVVLNAWKEQLPSTADYGSAENGYEQSQLTWLENEALNVDAGWTLIVITHSLYDVQYGSRNITRSPSNSKNIDDILDGYTGDGTIACVIQGHSHGDRITHTAGGIPIVITTCDKNKPYIYDGKSDLDFERPSGTIYEQAFDVVVLDKVNRKLTFVRIGAPALNGIDNNVGEQVEYREVTY